MAGTHCTVFSLLTPSCSPNTSRTYPLLVVSSIPTPNPSRIRHRKNYLRPKILKTLNEPYEPIIPLLPQELPPQSSTLILSPQTPKEHDLCVEITADGTRTTAGEGDKLEISLVSETTGECHGVAGKLSARSIMKYGAYLIGVFVFQTVCSVWILGRDCSILKAGDGREKSNFFINGIGITKRAANANNAFHVEDQLELEMKIEKIKLMASEARRIDEKKKEEIGDPEIGDASAVSSHRLGIKKEVNSRLAKLQNKINPYKDRSAVLHVNLGNAVKSKGGQARVSTNVNKGNRKLMFKKKLRYRSLSTKPTKTAKGFQGIRDRRASKSKKRDLARTGTSREYISAAADLPQILYEDKQVNQQDDGTLKSDGEN